LEAHLELRRPIAMEAHPETIVVILETWKLAMEAHPGAMEACPGDMEAHTGAMEAHPRAMVAHPRSMEAHPEGFCGTKSLPASCTVPIRSKYAGYIYL
jgi:hypothetical protein